MIKCMSNYCPQFVKIFAAIDLTNLILVWFGFFVLWHINVRGSFNASVILVRENQLLYLTHR